MKTAKFTGEFVPEPFPPGFDKLSQEKQDAFYAKRAAARWAHEHPDAPSAAQQKPGESGQDGEAQ
jgi:hypothetical protein